MALKDEAQDEDEEITQDKIKTTPFHNQFLTTNQAPHCWNRYNEWIMCLKTCTGNKEKKCKLLRQLAHSICPDDWMNKWDDERDFDSKNGTRTFAGIAIDDHYIDYSKKKKEGGSCNVM